MQTRRPPFRALTTNSSDSGFPSRIPTITEPSGNGVIDLVNNGSLVPERLRIWPFGLGANNDAFSVRLIGWHKVGTVYPFLWVPTIFAELGAVMGNVTGIAGAPVLNTEFFADTLTIVSEGTFTADVTRFGSIRLYSPANDTPAHAVIPLEPFDKIELTFDQTTNTPTMNALISLLDR